MRVCPPPDPVVTPLTLRGCQQVDRGEGGGGSECRWQVEEQSGCVGMKMAQPGQHGDKTFQEAPQFRRDAVQMPLFSPGWSVRVSITGCAPGGGREMSGCFSLFFFSPKLWSSGFCFGKTMADGNASILEEALCVHGHAAQSSAVLPTRLLCNVCVRFPSLSLLTNLWKRWKLVPAC